MSLWQDAQIHKNLWIWSCIDQVDPLFRYGDRILFCVLFSFSLFPYFLAPRIQYNLCTFLRSFLLSKCSYLLQLHILTYVNLQYHFKLWFQFNETLKCWNSQPFVLELPSLNTGSQTNQPRKVIFAKAISCFSPCD